jgi:hypothetical protein
LETYRLDDVNSVITRLVEAKARRRAAVSLLLLGAPFQLWWRPS